MKTQTKTSIILASLFLISYTGYSVPAEYKNSDNFPYKSTFRQDSDLVINNYYYGDKDYLYDYYYASRIRRFHRPWVSSGYYNSIYTDSYWYTWEPAYWGISIYMGSMWSPVRLGISFGGPAWYHYYDPYYEPYSYDWYRPVFYTSHVHYFHPTYRVVYRTKIKNQYYYGGRFGRHVRYSRPVYAYGYSKPYYSKYYPEYGYYSRSVKGTPVYRNKNINSGTPVNTRRREVISNTDNNRRFVTSGRTNSDVKRNSATTTNRRSTSYSNTNTRVVKKSVTTRPSTSGDRSGNKSDVSRRSSAGSSKYQSPSRRSSGSSNVSGSSRSGTSYKSSGNRTSNKTVSSRSKSSSSGSKYRKPSSGSTKKTNQVKQSRSTASKSIKKSPASNSTRRKK